MGTLLLPGCNAPGVTISGVASVLRTFSLLSLFSEPQTLRHFSLSHRRRGTLFSRGNIGLINYLRFSFVHLYIYIPLSSFKNIRSSDLEVAINLGNIDRSCGNVKASDNVSNYCVILAHWGSLVCADCLGRSVDSVLNEWIADYIEEEDIVEGEEEEEDFVI